MIEKLELSHTRGGDGRTDLRGLLRYVLAKLSSHPRITSSIGEKKGERGGVCVGGGGGWGGGGVGWVGLGGVQE